MLYTFFPILGYFQFKRENQKFQESQRFQFSFKEMRKANSNQPELQLIKWWFWAGVISLISILPLMGLPGGLLINLFQLFNLIPEEKLLGDMMWPLAILVSIIIPIAWLLAIAIRNVLKVYWNLEFRHTVKMVIGIWFVLILVMIRILVL